MDSGDIITPLATSDTISNTITTQTIQEKPKAKRGRRSKKEIAEMKEKEEQAKLQNMNNPDLLTEVEKPAPKKRGRKPKGGKIIHEEITPQKQENIKPNVMLHLKCKISDLTSIDSHEPDFSEANINSYDENNLSYQILNNTNTDDNLTNYQSILTSIDETSQKTRTITVDVETNETKISATDTNPMTKDLWKKLKSLEHILHINGTPDSKSACFWCTHDFDNPPVYIPKSFLKGSYHVYGCFCSPECAVAHLMKENIDSSSKFERYSLLNNIYNKIYDYKKNIKPAPDPHYLLEKFCGNLNIQEYRQLLSSDRLFLVVDKPLTRVLPEIHEDNDEFIINSKIIPTSSNYTLKKRTKQSQKTNSANENFGIFSMVPSN
jgi:hypothetical protein